MKKNLAITAVAASLFLGGVVACQPEDADSVDKSAPAQEKEVESSSLSPSDFTVDLKVKDKQCFGSAGCNVTAEPDVTYVGPGDVPQGSYSVTFEVTGDSAGPIIQTLEVQDGKVSDWFPEIFMSTPSSGTEIRAEVTEVNK
jgi:hypothetical protein